MGATGLGAAPLSTLGLPLWRAAAIGWLGAGSPPEDVAARRCLSPGVTWSVCEEGREDVGHYWAQRKREVRSHRTAPERRCIFHSFHWRCSFWTAWILGTVCTSGGSGAGEVSQCW